MFAACLMQVCIISRTRSVATLDMIESMPFPGSPFPTEARPCRVDFNQSGRPNIFLHARHSQLPDPTPRRANLKPFPLPS
jgi:hypothetical protein